MSCAVFPSTYRNATTRWCITCTLLFCAWSARYFFQRNTLFVIGIFEDDPLVEISWLLQCVQLHVFFPTKTKPQNRYKELSPNSQLYIVIYSRFCGYRDQFYTSCFFVKIDHDDGTVKHILSRLEAAQEQYNECSISHKHRVDCCIIT